MNIYYKYKKLNLKFKQLRLKKMDLTETQILTFSIVKSFISKKDSVLLVTLLSGKKYIKNESKGMFIVIYPTNSVFISNHKYSYYVTLPDEHMMILNKIYNRRLEKTRLHMESEITANVVTSLRELNNSFK